MEGNEYINKITSNRFVYNDYNSSRQVLKTLLDNLENCDEFLFSVAFINDSGLAKLKLQLKDLKKKNIKGRVIATNYLFFSEPKALKELAKIENVELRMFYLNDNSMPGFHTKGYIFKNKKECSLIIGSSNLTQSALTINQEWNTEIKGSQDAIAIKEVLEEYERLWKKSMPIEDVISSYEDAYNKYHQTHKYNYSDKTVDNLKPNAMQSIFISRLNELINKGETRGLLISATGTGKTYASAFGIKSIEKFRVKKLLFVTHREIILEQAKKTYENVFRNEIKTALYSGDNKNIENANFIFASHGMLIRDEHLYAFKENEFDVVIIDEVHKVGDNKYQKIINYFKPKFLLGMSATPDRTDNYDIYALFDRNIIYEIRLIDALESQMLTPFNYFGITDLTMENKLIDDLSDFRLLTCQDRVNNIINQANYFGFSGPRVKGLIFVSSIAEGKELSMQFNAKGFNTLFLDGSSSQDYREECIKRLEQNNIDGTQLDYIFTVDIFNEGVDIPSVNQIILLRPTQSAIIFIQQLGRGLRLNDEKDYVTVLDFIGNYDNNFFIPIALNKKGEKISSIHRVPREILPGGASIQFDEISKQQIYNSIDRQDLSSKRRVIDAYIDLKNRLGHIPSLIEFDTYDSYASLSSDVFLDKKVFDSYYDFLLLKDKDYHEPLKEDFVWVLRYISRYIGDGKRHEDIACLEFLIANRTMPYTVNDIGNLQKAVVNLFKGNFPVGTNSFTAHNVALIEQRGNEFIISKLFESALKDQVFKWHLSLIIDYAKYASNKYFDGSNTLVPYKKYSRSDVCRLLYIPTDDSSTMYGYRLYKELNVLPIFVTYRKKLEETATTNYDDRFINDYLFSWVSRNKRTTSSNEILEIDRAYKKGKLKISLFIQKQNSKNAKFDSDFYYVGDCNILDMRDTVGSHGDPVVRSTLVLEKPCKADIYDYIISPLGDDK